ncbi:MAG: hypothetical protein ACRCVS_02790 [Fusobacteriaceae bacterium]
MKKNIMIVAVLAMSVVTLAGSVTLDGKKTLTKIVASERQEHIKFESKFPSLVMRISKRDVLKGMTRIGKTRTIVEIERNGIINSDARNVGATLDRIKDGLWVKTSRTQMFITEKELKKIKK